MLEKLKKLKVNIGLKSIILIAVCALLIMTDLLTKVFEEKDKWNFVVIPNFIEVTSGSRNPGCAFSFLAEAAWGQTFLIVMTFIMLAVLITAFILLPERFTLLKVALSMITAGAIGNLVDRIAFREVRDFVGLNMFGNMVACNFADFWIVIGTAVAIIDILFINEWAIIPLTKRAKQAQAEKKEKENQASLTENTEPVVKEDNAAAPADVKDENADKNNG